MKILVLNGVNMNMLGKRDHSLYGSQTLDELQRFLRAEAKKLGVKTTFKHTNSEGKLCDLLQKTKCDAVVLNAGAYSHYSYAIRDCIECIGVPVAEVHMTDVSARESFRHVDVLADVCKARFVGKGKQSYVDAIKFFAEESAK